MPASSDMLYHFFFDFSQFLLDMITPQSTINVQTPLEKHVDFNKGVYATMKRGERVQKLNVQNMVQITEFSA